MSELVIITCAESARTPLGHVTRAESPSQTAGDSARALRCEAAPTPTREPSAREDIARETIEAARAALEAAGLGAPAPLIALDARLDGLLALTVRDAGLVGLTGFAGRPVILLSAGTETHRDVLIHELTHVWMRTHGIDDARWRVETQTGAGLTISDPHGAALRVSHESAVVQEGLADLVAAALTQDPLLYEGFEAARRSVRSDVRCPEGLTGFVHEDAAIVSGALWALGGDHAARRSEVLAALRTAVTSAKSRAPSVPADSGVAAFVDALGAALVDHPDLATRWRELVAERGLRECATPITLGPGRTSARAMDFLAAGTRRFDAAYPGAAGLWWPPAAPLEVTGPLRFQAPVEGVTALRVTGRSSARDALTLAWQAHDQHGLLLGGGRAPFEGWPSQYAILELPPESRTLTFGFVSSRADDVTYNDLSVAPMTSSSTPTITSSPPPTGPLGPAEPRGGCALGVQPDLALPLLVACFLGRRLRWARRPRGGAAPHGSPSRCP